jgi:hypothetical protein
VRGVGVLRFVAEKIDPWLEFLMSSNRFIERYLRLTFKILPMCDRGLDGI